MRKCPTCGVGLVEGENITSAQIKHQSYQCRECRSAQSKAIREKYPERYAKHSINHRKKWKDDPKWRGRRSFYERSRTARIMNQTPEDADMDAIQKMYEEREPGMTVDHIIPLIKGGPHHQDNLQYLTKSENSKKGTRL